MDCPSLPRLSIPLSALTNGTHSRPHVGRPALAIMRPTSSCCPAPANLHPPPLAYIRPHINNLLPACIGPHAISYGRPRMENVGALYNDPPMRLLQLHQLYTSPAFIYPHSLAVPTLACLYPSPLASISTSLVSQHSIFIVAFTWVTPTPDIAHQPALTCL